MGGAGRISASRCRDRVVQRQAAVLSCLNAVLAPRGGPCDLRSGEAAAIIREAVLILEATLTAHSSAALGIEAAPPAAVELSVVIPTFNERDNIEPLVEKLE